MLTEWHTFSIIIIIIIIILLVYSSTYSYYFVIIAHVMSFTDIPLSYGLLNLKIESQNINSFELNWDSRIETRIFVKLNLISTEFTDSKHGGVKGVPFRIQVETYAHFDNGNSQLVHCSSCQVKVFKVGFN